MAGHGPAIHANGRPHSLRRPNLKALFLKFEGDFADLADRVFRDSLRIAFEKRYSDNFAGEYYCHFSVSHKYNLIRWADEVSGEYILFVDSYPPMTGEDALIEKLLLSIGEKLQRQRLFSALIEVG